MNGMWEAWARRRRILGLGFLTGAAVAFAVAVLLFLLGHGYWSGALVVTAAALIVHAGFGFFDAHKYTWVAR